MNQYEHKLLTLQISSMFAFLLLAILGVCLPYFFMKMKTFQRILGYINCISVGILLGVSLLHIFPESGQVLNDCVNGYPVSYCINFIGILTILVVLNIGHNHDHNSQEYEQQPNQQVAHDFQTVADQRISDTDSAKPFTSLHLNNSKEQQPEQKCKFVASLLFGLVVHDVSEGIAMGLSQQFSGAIFLFIGICFHKWSDTMVQVVAGIKNKLSVKQNILMVIPVVVATPLAQLVTFLIVYLNSDHQQSKVILIIEDCFLSFACGSFLTISFVEIVNKEFHNLKLKQLFIKSLFVLIGFIIIAVSSVIEVVAGNE